MTPYFTARVDSSTHTDAVATQPGQFLHRHATDFPLPRTGVPLKLRNLWYSTCRSSLRRCAICMQISQCSRRKCTSFSRSM
jgi:hypothetical protein